MAKLKRTLKLPEVIFFGVGSILGAGIYTIIGKVAEISGYMMWFSFLLASIAAMLTAFAYAELVSAFPGAGGEYVYARKAIGRKAGTILGIIIIFSGIVSASTVAIGFAGYLTELLNTHQLIGSIGVLIALFLVNTMGIKTSSVVNVFFTIIEASGLVLVIYCAIPYLGKVDYSQSTGGINGIMTGASLSFFAYLGFEKLVKLAEETVNPEKTIPKALFISGGIVIVVYTAVALCAVSVLTPYELGNSSRPLADIVEKNLGRTGAITIAVIALFATSNTVLSSILGSSRVLLNMGRENKFLKMFSEVTRKKQTPLKALVIVLLFSCVFALIGNIETVAFITNLLMLLIFLIMNISVIVLRKTQPNMKRPFTIPGNINNIPVIAIAGIIITLIFMIYAMMGLTL
jgi:basic amino acid/polyamine antiporter, APA family